MNEPREHWLISRAVDGEATSAEWRELEFLANENPLLWRDLSQAQRDHAELTQAMSTASAIAETVALPRARTDVASPASASAYRVNRLGAWSGWAVAAMVAFLAWGRFIDPAGAPEQPIAGGYVQPASFGSAAQAFQAYLDRGRESGQVVGEMPTKVLLETKPITSGDGFEVLYLRQVLERTVVPDLFQVSGQDESGRPTLVRYELPVRSSM